LSSLLTLVSLPLAVRYLGAERFGVWATITSTVVLLNLLDLGIASTLTNHVARAYALGDRQYAARCTTNGSDGGDRGRCRTGVRRGVAES
jgi:O-antigen/teichoic acid export membrane protein